MKSFGKYISKHLASFALFVMILLLVNAISFVLTFRSIITSDYGPAAPQTMLEKAAAAATESGLSDEMVQELKENQIWAMFLNADGESIWSVDLPENVPGSYTLQDVAVFSKGYIADYPVFVRNMDRGLLILGYPQNSYTKLTGNYFSIRTIRTMPVYFAAMLVFDLLLLFAAYFLSKKKILKNTGPIIASIEALSEGHPASLSVGGELSVCGDLPVCGDLSLGGELSEIAESVNKASRIIRTQNQARANWISGVSHDIRTPLSMIMGYARRISCDPTATASIREQAGIIEKQSVKIKELVSDLNLVSRLEYEMQPLHKKVVRISKLLRSYMAELLNAGIPDTYSIGIEVMPDAEMASLECDERLLLRAVNNLVQNSIRHNPKGCEIRLSLDCPGDSLFITVEDNGVGLSREKRQEFEKRPHYMESTDERLDLRHGLGLLLVRQIVEVHGGTMQVESEPQNGYRTRIVFPLGTVKK